MRTFLATDANGQKIYFSIAFPGDIFFHRSAAMTVCDQQGWRLVKGMFM